MPGAGLVAFLAIATVVIVTHFGRTKIASILICAFVAWMVFARWSMVEAI